MVRADRFFFALFSLFRFSLSIGLLERPLFIGLLWALVTGDYEICLKIAIFFELAWLDIIPAGTYIPPHLGAAMFTALALTSLHGLTDTGQITLVMAAGIPMAWLGTRLEARQRTFQRRCHTQALQWARNVNAGPFPERIVYSALLRNFLTSWIFFFVSMLVLDMLLGLLLHNLGTLLDQMHVDWPHLWLAASLGGLLALRIRRAYAVFFSGAALAGLVMIIQAL
ncbi:MAG: PTS sugar transporter subunit IIC [Desulfovibrio sp.]